jgi:hypothetical protein
MMHTSSAKAPPSIAEVRLRFGDLDAVTVPMLRRSFEITSHTARQVLRLAKQEADTGKPPAHLAALMQRFGFSESEARWAYENVGMPE